MKNLKNESGITLIALIITIIILVILAAVSIRAVTNMKIVDYAVNGAENYAKAGKAENKTLDDTVSFIDEAVEKINKASEIDYTERLLAYFNSDEYKNLRVNEKMLLDGVEIFDLGPDFVELYTEYYLYKDKIYEVIAPVKVVNNGAIKVTEEVTLTNKDIDGLGYNEKDKTFTTVNKTYSEEEYSKKENSSEEYCINIRGKECYYNSNGLFLYGITHNS